MLAKEDEYDSIYVSGTGVAVPWYENVFFSLAVTLVGTIFIAVELKNGQDVTCSEMLINLNNYFHDSDRLMKVYQVLEDSEIEGDYSDKSLLFPMSRAKLMESLQIDHVSAAYNKDGNLIAYCVLVANLPGERNRC